MKLAIILLLLAPVSAFACGGVAGTGKVADGTVQARTAEQAKGTFVAADGYWTLCPTAAQTNAAPPLDCPGDGSFKSWTADGRTCTTASPSATSRTDPARDQGIKHGSVALYRQWQGPQRGMLIERCTDGRRSVVSASCAPVSHCDTRHSVSIRGKWYTYDARNTDKRVPVGGTATAVADDGSRHVIRCVAGTFQ